MQKVRNLFPRNFWRKIQTFFWNQRFLKLFFNIDYWFWMSLIFFFASAVSWHMRTWALNYLKKNENIPYYWPKGWLQKMLLLKISRDCLITLAMNNLEGWNIIHLKGEIHSNVPSTKPFMYDIEDPRSKRNIMRYQISKLMRKKAHRQ